jgi:hypothetical protein
MATIYNGDYMRSVRGQRPRIMDDVEELRKLVVDLRCKLAEQGDELARTKTDVSTIKRQLDKPAVLAKDQTKSGAKDPEPSIEAYASSAQGPSVAVLNKAADAGRWVIRHGQCWRRKGTQGFELVSDKELEAKKGVSWNNLRDLTDAELLHRHAIVRGGAKSRIGGYARGQLVPPERMEEANKRFLITMLHRLAIASQPTEKDSAGPNVDDSEDRHNTGDEGTRDESDTDEGDNDEGDEGDTDEDDENDADASDENKTVDGDSGEEADADKEPDLRRRQRRPLAEWTSKGTVKCNRGHHMRLNVSNGVRFCDKCEEDFPRGKKFWRCSSCDFNSCQACIA